MLSVATQRLYERAEKWERDAQDHRDFYHFRLLLDELLFHGHLRFCDYVQFQQQEGAFAVRLDAWLGNVTAGRLQKVLLRLAERISFVDARQMRSLYRDAYRRVIRGWLLRDATDPGCYLDPECELQLLRMLRKFWICSITESFNFPEFLHANDLSGLSKPTVLGEDIRGIAARLPRNLSHKTGVVVLEDFVGTGKQASRVLRTLRSVLPQSMPVLFVPLLMLERYWSRVKASLAERGILLEPVEIVPRYACLEPEVIDDVDEGGPALRSLVRETAAKVLVPLNDLDDVPRSAFGYKECGSLVVTFHNAPNNSLPLLHHKAPDWSPLFRRLHHAKDDG